MPDPIVCYFDFPSAHTYLGLNQLQDVAAKHDRAIDWRPVSIMDLWKAHDYMPIGNPIAKGRYIKKDFIRTAGLLGLPLNIPPSFPAGDLSGARQLAWHVRANDPDKAGALCVALMKRLLGGRQGRRRARRAGGGRRVSRRRCRGGCRRRDRRRCGQGLRRRNPDSGRGRRLRRAAHGGRRRTLLGPRPHPLHRHVAGAAGGITAGGNPGAQPGGCAAAA